MTSTTTIPSKGVIYMLNIKWKNWRIWKQDIKGWKSGIPHPLIFRDVKPSNLSVKTFRKSTFQSYSQPTVMWLNLDIMPQCITSTRIFSKLFLIQPIKICRLVSIAVLHKLVGRHSENIPHIPHYSFSSWTSHLWLSLIIMILTKRLNHYIADVEF